MARDKKVGRCSENLEGKGLRERRKKHLAKTSVGEFWVLK